MSIIQQTRQDILLNNNTAQQQFENILELETLKSPIVNVSIMLNGDLNLNFLKNEKYKHIKEIIFSEGKITSIEHVPPTIEKLHINNNYLMNLEDLPISLKHLSVNENYISHASFKELKHLEILNIADNKLETLELPNSLKVLDINNNNVKFLDARMLPHLRELYIKNNSLLIIDNFSLLELEKFETQNNPLLNLSKTAPEQEKEMKENNVEFLDALNKYFNLKQKYTISNNKKCIKCKRNVGTIFSNKDHIYSAICGSKRDPCSLNIKLYRGEFTNSMDMVNTMRTYIENDKEDIIKLKMDTIFNYVSEESSARLFKKKMEEFNENNELYNAALQEYNNIVNNKGKIEKVENKKKEFNNMKKRMKDMLNDYEKTNNKKKLVDAMKIYVDELQPTSEIIQNLTYPTMEVDENVLYQYELTKGERQITFDEPPKVLNFTV